MARVDARCLRLHLVPADHGANFTGISCPFDRCSVRAVGDVVAEAGWRRRLRLARRPGRAQDPADDLDPVVFAQQFRGGLLANFHLSVPVPRAARHWHGRRMAGRWRTRNGDVAGTFARLHGWRPARLMGTWLYAVERRLWLVLCLYRLARHAVDRCFARAFRFLCTQIRQGAADLAGESATSAP
jgi:hypothetical protein